MPNYRYRGLICGEYYERFLPISSDPKEQFECSCGADVCDQIRVISKSGSFKGFKVWAGDWFKKTYGHDMGDGAAQRVSEREQYDKDKAAAEKDGAKFTFKSKQVGGQDRIKVPDKKDD